MRVFVTGATGFVGSAVVAELIGAGHSVLGLVRSDEAAERLAATGAEPHRGELTDLASLRSGAEAADAVVHTGFIHDFAKFRESCEIDRVAIIAMGEALDGSDRHMIITSGIGVLPQGEVLTEVVRPAIGPAAHPRAASEEAAVAASDKGVRVSVMRLPPSVHGAGDHGFVPMLIGMARKAGVSGYAGLGANRWPAVHRLDAARAYRLALEKQPEGGIWHAVAEEGLSFRDIAEAIGRGLGIRARSMTAEEAAANFGWFTHFAAMNVPAKSDETRAKLGWSPSQPGLIADMEASGYFAG